MPIPGREILREEYHQRDLVGVHRTADACARDREPGGLDNDQTVYNWTRYARKEQGKLHIVLSPEIFSYTKSKITVFLAEPCHRMSVFPPPPWRETAQRLIQCKLA